MATLTKFNAFPLDLSNKVHNLGSDTLQVALSSVAPVATNAVLADLTEISYTNLSSRVVTTTSNTQTSGVAKLVLADLTLTATGAVAGFRYISLYNNTAAAKNLIGFIDIGSTITLDGSTLTTFLIDFDQAAGALTIT